MADIAVFQKDFEALKSDHTKLCERIKVTLEKQDEEIRTLGKSTLETGALLRKQDEQWVKIAEDVKGVQARLDEFSAKQGRLALLGGAGTGSLSTPGQILVASEQFTSMVKSGAKSSEPVELEGGLRRMLALSQAAQRIASKAGDLTSAEVGALVNQMRLDQVVQAPLRPRTLLDFIPIIPTSSNSIEWPRENKTYVLYAELASQASSGQKNLVLGLTPYGKSRARGFRAGQQVVISDGELQREVGVVDSIDHSTGTLVLADNLTNIHPAGRSVTAADFVFVPEAQYKPMGRVEFTLENEPVKTLPVWTPIARQALRDAPQVQGLIDSRLREYLELSLEHQILQGAGGSDEFLGILSDPDINEYSWSSGLADDTKLDAIRRAMTVTALNFFPTDVVVLHPYDTEELDTLKGDDGQYVYAQIQVGGAPPTVWRAARVESSALPQGTGLSGSFRMGCVLFDREEASMRVSESHEDFFVRNMVALLMELRAAFIRPQPKSFTKITFDSPPAGPTP